MVKKIVFIQGSPRKTGNTRAMASLAMEAAKEKKAEVAEIDATALDFKKPGCVGCSKCQQSEKFECSLDDGIAHAVATLPQYDTIVLATPIYWFSYSAQIKMFVDRMFSLIKFGEPGDIRTPLAGKAFGLLATGGGDIANNLELLERQWKIPADMMGNQFHSCLFPFAPPKAGALMEDASAVAKAKQFGASLA